MTSFYKTVEFHTLSKIIDRMYEVCTLKNMILYAQYLEICIKLAKERYNDIGYDPKTCTYRWMNAMFTEKINEKYTEYQLETLFRNCGNDYEKMLRWMDNGTDFMFIPPPRRKRVSNRNRSR